MSSDYDFAIMYLVTVLNGLVRRFVFNLQAIIFGGVRFIPKKHFYHYNLHYITQIYIFIS